MFGRITLFCLALLANLMIGCESTGSSKSSSASASGSNNAAYKKATSATYNTYAKAHGPVRVLRTTAYHCHEEDHIAYGNKSAYGTPLRYGKVRSAAADWSRFPIGTVFRIQGLPHLFIIDDYGSALVGKDTLDLYTRSKQEMNYWGARHVKVEFLRWGSYDLSYKILAERMKHPHCRQMAMAIKAKRPGVEQKAAAIALRKPKTSTAPRT
jgi:3D (Asp-Asp-Asp) domain-containing protein